MRKSKPRPWHALTPEKVEALDSPGRYTDGGCLSLVVRLAKNGDHLLKHWVFRTTTQGRRVDMSLGNINIVSLAKARVLAYKYRGLAKEGINPILYRQKERKAKMTEDMAVASKLELAFTPKQISYLAHTSCASFVEDQPGRFEIHDVSENEHLMGSGFLHWLENDSYLSAIVMQQACVARGFHASILIDDADDEKNEWVVWTDDPLDMERAND